MNDLTELLIPLIVFTTIVLVIALALKYQFKSKKLKMETIRLAIENMEKVDHKMINAIANDSSRKNADLRRGFIFLAIALAIALFSQFISILKNPHIEEAVLGISIFPAIMGMTYIGFYFLSSKK